MKIINVHDAKTNFSKLLERVAAGEEIVIGKNGRPVAKLVPEPALTLRRPGALKGKIKLASDFDAPIPGYDQALAEPIDADTN